MTVTASDRSAARFRAPEGRPINWEMVAAILAGLAQFAYVVWTVSGIEHRLVGLEQQLPAGMIQRLDERTLQMQQSLARLEAAK